MPRYNFKLTTGEHNGAVIEVPLTLAQYKKRVRPDGSISLGHAEVPSAFWTGKPVRATRDFASEVGTVNTSSTKWPLVSEAAGVHPSQVKEAAAYAAGKGCPTEFTKEGAAIFRDRAHRKQFLKAHGMIDRNGGYGD